MVNVNTIRPGSYATVAEAKEGGSGGVTKEYVDEGLATKQDTLTAGTNITIEGDVISATGGTEYSAGSGIAISGENVISNSAPNVQADWEAVSGEAVILHKPTIPAAQVQSDWDQADNTAVDYIKNKPTIPDAQVQSNWNESDSNSKAYIQNKPTIPTVGDAVLTIQKNGTDVATFGANASSNVTANISVSEVPSTSGASQGDVLTFDGTNVGWVAGGGGGTPSNMVTTDTAQTISGAKTLTADLTMNKSTGYNRLDVGDDTAIGQYDTRTLTLAVKGSVPVFESASITENPSLYITKARDQFKVELGTGTTYSGNLSGCAIGVAGNVRTAQSSYPCGAYFHVMNVGTYQETMMGGMWNPAGDVSNTKYKSLLATQFWVSSRSPKVTITGDGTTTAFTANHSLGVMPGIVQVTNDTTGAVEDVQIVKSTTNVTVTFQSAPANGDTYTVAMLY